VKMNFRNASCTDVTGIGPIRSIVRSFEQKPVRAECSNGRLNDAAIGLALPLKKPSKVNDVIGTTNLRSVLAAL